MTGSLWENCCAARSPGPGDSGAVGAGAERDKVRGEHAGAHPVPGAARRRVRCTPSSRLQIHCALQ